jgi:type IV pilus assembly protein PilA
MKNTKKKGFTLVELVIVIAVIAILAGVLIGTFASVITRANQSKALQTTKAQFDETWVDFVADNHQVPGWIHFDETTGTIELYKGSDYTSVVPAVDPVPAADTTGVKIEAGKTARITKAGDSYVVVVSFIGTESAISYEVKVVASNDPSISAVDNLYTTTTPTTTTPDPQS